MIQKFSSPKNLTTLFLITLISSILLYYFPYKNFGQQNMVFEEALSFSFGLWMVFVFTYLFVYLIMNLLSPYFSETQVNQYSSLLLALTFSGLIIPFIRTNVFSMRDSLYIGLYWCFSYLLFHMIFGLIVKGQSFGKWVDEYNIFNGKMASMVFLTQMFAPLASVSFLQ